jgi:anaerobic selenocysteine-containing dehydrogenase
LEEIAYKDLKFETPSGKIELYSATAQQKWGISPWPEFIPVSFTNEQNKYTLSLITPNAADRIHSQFGNMKIIREVTPAATLEISPGDAAERSIRNGENVRVFNERGEFIITVSVTNRIPRGIVSVPNGIWLNEGGGSNRLISPAYTDIGYGAAFHDTKVEVEKVNQ